MELIIRGMPKEIAAFITAIQNSQEDSAATKSHDDYVLIGADGEVACHSFSAKKAKDKDVGQ